MLDYTNTCSGRDWPRALLVHHRRPRIGTTDDSACIFVYPNMCCKRYSWYKLTTTSRLLVQTYNHMYCLVHVYNDTRGFAFEPCPTWWIRPSNFSRRHDAHAPKPCSPNPKVPIQPVLQRVPTGVFRVRGSQSEVRFWV